MEKLPKWPNFGPKFLVWASFSANRCPQKKPEKANNSLFGPKNIFSPWQFSYLLFLVPGKGQSSSWQNKKLRTLGDMCTVVIEKRYLVVRAKRL